MTGVRQNLHWWSVRGAVWSWSSFPLWSASTDRWWFWKRRGGRMADTSASILQAKWLPVGGKGTGLFACKWFGPAAFLELVISSTQRFPPFCMCNITWEVGKRVTPWPLPKPMNELSFSRQGARRQYFKNAQESNVRPEFVNLDSAIQTSVWYRFPGNWLKSRFWFRRSGVGPRTLHF